MSKATFDPTHYNPSSNPPFSTILEREISRRTLLKRGCGMAALSMFGGWDLTRSWDRVWMQLYYLKATGRRFWLRGVRH